MSYQFPQVTPNHNSASAPLPEELLADTVMELEAEIERLNEELAKTNNIAGYGWFAFFGLCAGLIASFAFIS